MKLTKDLREFIELLNSHSVEYVVVPVAFLGRDALLKNKRASGRAKDIADADAIDGE